MLGRVGSRGGSRGAPAGALVVDAGGDAQLFSPKPCREGTAGGRGDDVFAGNVCALEGGGAALPVSPPLLELAAAASGPCVAICLGGGPKDAGSLRVERGAAE